MISTLLVLWDTMIYPLTDQMPPHPSIFGWTTDATPATSSYPKEVCPRRTKYPVHQSDWLDITYPNRWITPMTKKIKNTPMCHRSASPVTV